TFLLGLTHPDLLNHISIRRAKPHHAPIIWQMDTDDPIKAADPTPVTRKLIGRARLSLWGGADFVNDKNLQKNVVDDISLLVTVQNNDTDMSIVWDIGLQQAKGNSAVGKFLDGCIASAHKAGIQLLAGYALVDRGKDRIIMFDKWLDGLTGGKSGVSSPSPEDFADDLVAKIDGQVGTDKFDGISFDIESCGLLGGPLSVPKGQPPLPQSKIDAMRAILKRFYKRVAENLATTNRVCAITVGGMMSDDAAIKPLPSVPNVNPNAALAAKLHVYDIAKQAENIIIRPMAYDNAGGVGSDSKIPQFNSDPAQLEWHEAIVKFALGEKKLHPGQFQLGMKRFIPRDDNGTPTGQGGNVEEPARQDARATMLRKYRCGLTLFAMGKTENWGRNTALNKILNKKISGSDPLDTNVEGQPMQVPLDADQVKKLKKS
ncbi:MAG TPA: hypothetical protein VL463_36655, partial [Kofleriaceae bacterium]|nr:hypothetical protein [Kofleriaceae bacterium]